MLLFLCICKHSINKALLAFVVDIKIIICHCEAIYCRGNLINKLDYHIANNFATRNDYKSTVISNIATNKILGVKNGLQEIAER